MRIADFPARARSQGREKVLRGPMRHVLFLGSQFSAGHSSPPNVSSTRWGLRLIWAGVRRLSRGKTAAHRSKDRGASSQCLVLVARNRTAKGTKQNETIENQGIANVR